jgi:hypothetical protein
VRGFATANEAAENAALWIKLRVHVDSLTDEQLVEYLAKPDCDDFVRGLLLEEQAHRAAKVGA